MTDAPKSLTKARLPRGLQDRGPADLAAERAMVEKIREVYERYGFDAVETPFFEYTETLGKFLPDTERPNEGVFSFQDDDEQWLSLRYDLTAPLARYVAENFDALPKPYRSYRSGYVFRNEKPGPGRYRQFMQFDADTVGSSSPAADAEMCMMAADCMEALGLKGQFVIKVNNRKVLDGVMDNAQISNDKRLTVLRAIDKLDRLGVDGVTLLLGAGRRDDSGDFTKGAGLTPNQIDKVMVLFEIDDMAAHSRQTNPLYVAQVQAGNFDVHTKEDIRAKGIFGGLLINLVGSAHGLEGASELQAIWDLLKSAGYDDGRIRIDPSVVRGLEYYTGPVFEAELTFEVKGDDGKPVRFGSVGGGGRYDGLVGRFRAEPVPATGFSIGVSRLLAALQTIKSPIVAATKSTGPVVVLVMDKSEIAHYQKLVATLRAENIRAELYLGASGMNAQLKYADRRGSVCAVIQGSNEREKGEVTIKDLVAGAQLGKAAKDMDRAEYLELKQKAQFAVAESGLVAAVRQVLARHGG